MSLCFLKFLTTELSAMAANIHGENVAILNRPTYFKEYHDFKIKENGMLLWGRGSALIYIENDKLWLHSRLMKSGLIEEDP